MKVNRAGSRGRRGRVPFYNVTFKQLETARSATVFTVTPFNLERNRSNMESFSSPMYQNKGSKRQLVLFKHTNVSVSPDGLNRSLLTASLKRNISHFTESHTHLGKIKKFTVHQTFLHITALEKKYVKSHHSNRIQFYLNCKV